jgi:hypothetical protein
MKNLNANNINNLSNTSNNTNTNIINTERKIAKNMNILNIKNNFEKVSYINNLSIYLITIYFFSQI